MTWLETADNPLEERILHLVQDEEMITEIQTCHLPPDEYYEELSVLWNKWWPEADKDLLEHMMSVLIAFDTATAFAMSFGIAKFALAQVEAKLVGGPLGDPRTVWPMARTPRRWPGTRPAAGRQSPARSGARTRTAATRTTGNASPSTPASKS